MEGGSLEQMMLQNPRGCRDEGFLREVCHNVLKVCDCPRGKSGRLWYSILYDAVEMET